MRACAERGLALSMVNLGGGFPTKYLKTVPMVEAYGESIFRALSKHFGNRIPETIIEPGRGMVGNAGVIEAEVVLVSKKSRDEDEVRWVYLDIGKFGGLAETMDESIRYQIRTRHDGAEMAGMTGMDMSSDGSAHLTAEQVRQFESDTPLRRMASRRVAGKYA